MLDSCRYAFDVVVRQEVIEALRKSRSVAAGIVIADQTRGVIAHDAVRQSSEVPKRRLHPVEPSFLRLTQSSNELGADGFEYDEAIGWTARGEQKWA